MSTKQQAKSGSNGPMHAVPSGGSMDVPLNLIKVDAEFNVRQTQDEEKTKELAKSMHSEGQLQDAIVEPNGDGTYTLRAGHRRFAAANLLEWETLRCMVWLPTDKSGAPLTDAKEKEIERYFVNLAENVARANISSYDLAMRCKLMKRRYGLKGDQIAKRLGKNTGHINNLLQIAGEGEKGEHAGNTLAQPILDRWKEECSWGEKEDDLRNRVCRINELRRWVRMSHEDQIKEFNEEMFVNGGEKPGDREEYRRALAAQNGTSAAGAGAGKDATKKEEGAVRAGKAELEKALEAAKHVKSETPKSEKDKIARLNGVIDGLDFALGVKKGLTNRITGVCAFKDGVMTEGMPEPKKESGKGN